jgi:hypothetical protein
MRNPTLLFALLGYILICDGCVVWDNHGFGGQSNIHIVEGLKSDIWVSPQSKAIGIPLFCQYDRRTAPFDIRLQIWDESQTYSSIEVSDIELQYDDGEIDRKKCGWKRDLSPNTFYQGSSKGRTETTIMGLSQTMESVFDQHKSVTITLRGRLTKIDGETVDFTASEHFEPEDQFWIAPFWTVIAGV